MGAVLSGDGDSPMKALIRDYRPQDLGQILQVWEEAGTLSAGTDSLSFDQAVDLINSEHAVVLVAEAEGEQIIGAALGTVCAVVGWIYRLSLVSGRSDEQEVAQRLLEQLEARLAQAGARKVAAIAGDDGVFGANLVRRGYRVFTGVGYFERDLASLVAPTSALVGIGGRMIASGLWDELRGMEEVKEIIERRVILPLAQAELAARHGVVPPRAIVLFGPPGTGKTTFAKGIASRLGWPFVEIQPAELAEEGPERQPTLLAEVLERVLVLASAVVFVDEVEDLASLRHESRRVGPSVTNEFLKQIPRLREAPHHLLVCATNWVGRLDPAFLRPGRFDYILPVGLPDAEARGAIWHGYIEEITDEPIDLATLVQASELFTPADIEFAARKAAQRAFEREHFESVPHRATTADFLATIRDTRPTLTAEMVASFEDDRLRFARF
jgi:transitional endoplasmic reticulum ATPase